MSGCASAESWDKPGPNQAVLSLSLIYFYFEKAMIKATTVTPKWQWLFQVRIMFPGSVQYWASWIYTMKIQLLVEFSWCRTFLGLEHLQHWLYFHILLKFQRKGAWWTMSLYKEGNNCWWIYQRKWKSRRCPQLSLKNWESVPISSSGRVEKQPKLHCSRKLVSNISV